MNITLHLTNACNFSCRYCYVDKSNSLRMSFDTAKKAIALAVSEGIKYVGIAFFGGEPLLMKDLIFNVVEYTKYLSQSNNVKFGFKLVTNGMLLDEDFIRFSVKENIMISISHDGTLKAHDSNRLDAGGKGTYEQLLPKVKQLLSYKPYSPVMLVINPETVQYFTESVQHLYDIGFRFIITTMNYKAAWDDRDMKLIQKEYKKLSKFYYDKTKNEEKFYFGPFDVKINSYIDMETRHKNGCELGKSQISVAPDGTLYPCVQFVGERHFEIGNVDTGIDRDKRDKIFIESKSEKKACSRCSIKGRCISYCACLNKQTTGNLYDVSPVLCTHERILIPIADRLAEKLYQKRSSMFIHKHYNPLYPVVSLMEDRVDRYRDS